MTQSTRFPAIARLNQQPVAQAELNHQNRAIPRPRRRWMRWIDRIYMFAIYVIALVLPINEIIGIASASSDYRPYYRGSIQDVLVVLTVIGGGTIVIVHFRRMLQTLSLSANSIARERGINNWDMLVLTGIDAGKIVRGKWWATMRHMWRPYLMLGILRALFVIWYAASTTRSYIGYASYYNNDRYISGAQILPSVLLQALLAGGAVLALTLANLGFTAACGVTAFNKRSSIALARAIGTRILIIIGIGLLCFLVLRFWVSYSYTNFVPSIVGISLITLIDNGVTVGSQIAAYNFYGFYGDSNINSVVAIYIPAAILALLLYALLTFLLLRLAQWQAVRDNALPPAKRKLIQIV